MTNVCWMAPGCTHRVIVNSIPIIARGCKPILATRYKRKVLVARCTQGGGHLLQCSTVGHRLRTRVGCPVCSIRWPCC